MTAREGKEYAFKTIQGYKTSFKHFRSFILQLYAVEDILISKIDQSIILEYKKYLLMEKKFGLNTVNRYLKHLKNITSQCLNEGTLKKNPFNKITLGFKESDRMPLTELELERLMQHPFRNATYQKVRDIFVLSCLTGLSYIDVKNLSRKNIIEVKEGQFLIKGSRQKSSSDFIVPLLPKAKEIIDRYSKTPEAIQAEVLIPILSNQKMNQNLKVLSETLAIGRDLSYHIARYTFIATVCAANGIDERTIGKMAGQRSAKITAAYNRKTEDDVIRAMRNLEGRY